MSNERFKRNINGDSMQLVWKYHGNFLLSLLSKMKQKAKQNKRTYPWDPLAGTGEYLS